MKARAGFAVSLGIALALSVAFACAAQAEEILEIRIEQGIESALPIAIVPFDWTADIKAPENVSAIIAADLKGSGRFAPLPAADLPSRPAKFSEVNFKDWRLLGMDNLLIGEIQQITPERFSVEFRLIDVIQQKQIIGFRIPTGLSSLRQTAHHISDIVYEAILKTKGAFATRIAYVTVAKKRTDDGKLDQTYRLQVADSDGFNARTILKSKEPLLSPAWSPSGDRIAYVSFEDKNSAIYVQNIRTGARKKIVSGAGINSSPAFSPDGTRLAVTRSKQGNPDIYLVDIASGRQTRLTTHSAIDTEASWMPNGNDLVFTSDRGGGPQIYRISAGGGKAQRLTFGMGSYNAKASVSPDGKRLAVVNGGDRGYRIAVVDLERDNYDVLTNTRLDESPSFAPNGAMIIYATMGRRGTELAAVSVDGKVKQRLGVQRGEIREPAWGPMKQ
ncbi:MAG: Tol-Pal system beta propeller repeat protein TolB [Gammaproteobacteria bacterium]